MVYFKSSFIQRYLRTFPLIFSADRKPTTATENCKTPTVDMMLGHCLPTHRNVFSLLLPDVCFFTSSVEGTEFFCAQFKPVFNTFT